MVSTVNETNKASADSGLSSEDLLFADQPSEYFGNSYTKAHSVPRDELHRLQIGNLRRRFADLRGRVPMLEKLADRQGIDSIDRLEDVVPLLFEHTMYKSYPPQLLEESRFADINRWLGKLTVHDPAAVDVSACECLDDWIDAMDAESPLALCVTSGTTGTMSLMPHSKEEMDRHVRTYRMTYLQSFGDDPQEAMSRDLHILWPYFRYPSGGHSLDLDLTVKYLLQGDESRMHPVYPGRMSLDVLFLSARMRAAQAKGELDKLDVGPAMRRRKAEFEELDRDMPEQMDRFFDRAMEELRGERIFLIGTWVLLHGLASRGLARGFEKVFSPDSILITGGGAKGVTPPDNWQDDVSRFVGVPRFKGLYAMTEGLARHTTCREGHYHLAPWIVPYVLDPDTSKPLPRQGTVTGRMAFYDLLVDSHWGGFISGDEVTINWSDPCPCGQTSVYLQGTIQRYSEKRGGDDKISCAARPGAHKEAMDFLMNLRQ